MLNIDEKLQIEFSLGVDNEFGKTDRWPAFIALTGWHDAALLEHPKRPDDRVTCIESQDSHPRCLSYDMALTA